MAQKYITSDGDTVDKIVWDQYGTTSNGVVEQVYASNPALADLGAVLPMGVVIVLPVLAAPTITQGIRLWD